MAAVRSGLEIQAEADIKRSMVYIIMFAKLEAAQKSLKEGIAFLEQKNYEKAEICYSQIVEYEKHISIFGTLLGIMEEQFTHVPLNEAIRGLDLVRLARLIAASQTAAEQSSTPPRLLQNRYRSVFDSATPSFDVLPNADVEAKVYSPTG